MNKFKITMLSLSVLVISTFTTALATDLKSAWLEYEQARITLHESFKAIDHAWNEASGAWTQLDSVWNEINNSWNVVDSAWVEVENARAIVASSLKIKLYDSSPRITRETCPRTYHQSTMRHYEKPYTPEPTWGSWDELSHAWTSLDKGWISANGAWAELDKAWPELGAAYDEAAQAWTCIDQAFAQTATAFQEIDAAWAKKNKH